MHLLTRMALLALVVFAAVPRPVAAEEVQFPIQVVDANGNVTVATGLLSNWRANRQERRQQRQGQPQQPAPGERTQPVDPAAPPALNGGTVAVEGVGGSDNGFSVNVELTPEQKTAIFEAIKTFILALLAVFTAQSTQGGFLGTLLSKANVPGVTPAPAPTKTKAKPRKRAPKPAAS